MEVSSQEQEAVAVAVAVAATGGGGGEFPLLLPGINNNNSTTSTTNGHDDGGGRHHMHHHHLIMNHLHNNNNIISPSSGSSSVVLLPHQQNHTTTNGSLQQQSEEKEGGEVVPAAVPYKKMKMKKKLLVGVGSSSSPPRPSYVYKECLKNHAAGMGSIATDGCGEFMPSEEEEEEGTLQPLTCSACGCHRNFHRKQLAVIDDYHQQYFHTTTKFILGHPEPLSLAYHPNSINILPSRVVPPPPPPMIMQLQPSSDHYQQELQEEATAAAIAPPHPHPHPRVNIIKKRRFRTKFSKEQKEQMLRFAERVGWKIQKQEESLVQQVCQEIGVKRRVLKVWMHNNKHNRRSS